VYEALHEAGIAPDWVIGTSIGAINGAIIAGNKAGDRLPRLRELWERFQQPQFSALWWTFVRGIPDFFTPRVPAWGGPQAKVGLDAASYYSTAPLRETLASLIDVAVLNSAHPRLTVGAVNVKSGELRYFDSRDGALGLEEIMASRARCRPVSPRSESTAKRTGTAGCTRTRRSRRCSTTIRGATR
jgi:NTE family protein